MKMVRIWGVPFAQLASKERRCGSKAADSSIDENNLAEGNGKLGFRGLGVPNRVRTISFSSWKLLLGNDSKEEEGGRWPFVHARNILGIVRSRPGNVGNGNKR